MIEVYELDSLLKKYGIDASKILSKNDTILDRGEYQDIDKTLDYLINELGINSKNIEKCPSIMYFDVDNIRRNYEFLIKQGVNISSIETALSILNTEPNILKETYYYVLDNYGKEYINKSTTILRVPVSRIIAIERILGNKSLIRSAACSWNSTDEIEKIIAVCQKNSIPVTCGVFRRTANEIEEIVSVCKKSNIPIASSMFKKTANEIEKIIAICKKNDILPVGGVFLRTANEIEEIVSVCKKSNIPIVGTMFHKTVDEIEKIIVVCKNNNISITSTLFLKTADEIERIVAICKKNNVSITGNIFLKPADEIEEIVSVCKKNDIPITGNVFHRTANEIEQIIAVCKESNVPITGSMFLKALGEIRKIIMICKKNDIPITGGVFLKTADEIKRIVTICNENIISITGSVFYRTSDELEESIEYVKSIYGEAYLKPLIVNKNVEYLKVVLPYLDTLNVLPVVIKSASILSLTLDEIIDRKEYIDSHNGELVLPNGRFNSIFGLSRANYRKLIGKKEECLRLCRK